MNPENRKNVSKYLQEAKPVSDEGWEESRLAVRWNGMVFLIENNFPHWTVSQILDFYKSIPGAEIFDLKVKVVPEHEQEA